MQVSWSFMRAYEACPYQQKLIRIDKLGPEKPDERRFIRGTAGHKVFEIWAKSSFGDGMKPEMAAKIFDTLVAQKHIGWLNPSDKEKMRNRVIAEAAMLMEAVRYHGIDRLKNLQVESWLSASLLGEHVIKGLLDVVIDGGTWLLETKMSDNQKWIDPDQLVFYGLLLTLAKNRYPSRLSFFLPVMRRVEERLLDIDFSQDDFGRINNRIQNFVDKWTAGEFPATGEGETCRWCEVKNYCIKRKPSHKNRFIFPTII
ncbi:MAG TPA: hypothetical protein DGG95_09690 [Cytophagales bacterium]|jgi:hypothetical protein|nr:hypothetical protein [Cytophagales bacterium]